MHLTIFRCTSVLILLGLPLAALAAYPSVGERHGVAHTPSAAVRDAQHRDAVRYTVWYPSVPGAKEQPLEVGPPGSALFVSGSAAREAPVVPGRWPVLLLSHGNGGSARMMGWFGTAMARAGYLVIAVDHPGNNGMDPMTLAGSTLSWERATDLAAALAEARRDPVLSTHMDPQRLGIAGFSAGGFTALLAAGARADVPRFQAFCRSHPEDGVCAPQQEGPEITLDARLDALKTPELAPYAARAGDDHAIAGVRAVFLMAPAIIQALDPEQMERLTLPVSILLGDDDTVAPPATNGRVAAKAIPGAQLTELAGVGHYDFLGNCTDVGRRELATLCRDTKPRQTTHEAAIRQAVALFARAMPPN